MYPEFVKYIPVKMNHAETADQLFLSKGIVQNYASSILVKLDVSNPHTGGDFGAALWAIKPVSPPRARSERILWFDGRATMAYAGIGSGRSQVLASSTWLPVADAS